MISAMSWVPRGAAAANPVKYEPSGEELEQLRAVEEQESLSLMAVGSNPRDLPADLDMNHYDDDDNAMDADEAEDDPYITNPAEMDSDGEDAEEDMTIKESDAVLLVCKSDEDYSCLEVYVYDEEEGNLYVHHEIGLKAFPLCISWIGHNPETRGSGNFAAVGTFRPDIEIWNLDVVDVLEPTVQLGGAIGQHDGGLVGGGALKSGSHTEAVMSLSWNLHQKHVLASGSADTTVKLWDIATGSCLMTSHHHSDKVQAVQWHPLEQTVIITGGFDKNVCLMDVRQTSLAAKCATDADVEMLQWNPHNAAQFAVSTENGKVTLYDARNCTAPVFTLQAHDKPVSSISFSCMVPGFFGTMSIDKTVKLWDMGSGSPSCLSTKSMGVGDLLCGGFFMNDPFLMAVGGSNGQVAIWETSENSVVERTFSSRVKNMPTVVFDPSAEDSFVLAKPSDEEAVAALGASSSPGKKKKKRKKKKQ